VDEMERISEKDGDDFPLPYYDGHPAGMFLHDEEGQGLGTLVEAVCAWQKKFGIVTEWFCTYSYRCDKPRAGAFGGGIVVCHGGDVAWEDIMERREHLVQQIKENRVACLIREADPDNDEFKCARCNRISDIENSVRIDGELYHEECEHPEQDQ